MRIYEVLDQTSTSYLYEGLTPSNKKFMHLWESAGQKLIEADLTIDQINQIFSQVEKDATSSGSNRTMIGKGKDAASAVNRAWEDLKTKIQNSKPIKNVDAMYDQAADKLKQATGGDQGVMQYVQKYRDFAKKHPVAQSFIYAALIGAAGISSAGLGGAAALGLFKMVDKLLQGEKFSSAAYSGAKTGAAAYAAGKIGQAMQGSDKFSGTDTWRTLDGINKSTIENGKVVGDIIINNQVYSPGSEGYEQALKIAMKHAADSNMLGTAKDFTAAASKSVKDMGKGGFDSFKDDIQRLTNSHISENQIKSICVAVTNSTLLNEGPLDALKGLATKGINKAKTVGHNLTTKITADKLMQAWKKAGSPTDSDAVADVLVQAGANKDIVNQAISAVTGKTTTEPATDKPNQTVKPTTSNKFSDMIAKVTAYIDGGGNVTPKLRGAVKDIWMQMGGVKIESRD